MLNISKIHQRRLELNLSQQALGEAIEQDQPYIAQLENGGITDIMTSTFLRLARTLQVPMEELVLDPGATPRQEPERRAPNADVNAKVAANTQRIPAPQFDLKPSAPELRWLEDVPAEERAAQQALLIAAIKGYSSKPPPKPVKRLEDQAIPKTQIPPRRYGFAKRQAS